MSLPVVSSFTESEQLTEKEIQKLEQQTLYLHFHDLVKNSVPPLWKDLESHLKKCITILRKPAGQRDRTKPDSDSVMGRKVGEGIVSINSSDGLVKGSVCLGGHDLQGVNVTIKLPRWSRNTTLAVQSQAPIVLHQLHAAHGHLAIALEEMRAVHAAGVGAQTMMSLHVLLQQVSAMLTRTLDQITLPSAITFPNSLMAGDAFQQALPDDVVVEFSVQKCSLVVMAVAFQRVSGNRKTGGGSSNQSNPSSSNTTTNPNASTQSSANESSLAYGSAPDAVTIGATCIYKNCPVQVVDVTRCLVPLTGLEELKVALTNASVMCREFRELVGAHMATNTTRVS